MNKLFIFLFCTTLSVMASEEESQIFLDNRLQKLVPILRVKDSRISDNELCRKKLCIAAKMAINGFTIKKLESRINGGANPISQICETQGGQNRVYYSKDKGQVSVCEFSDRSFILAWDMLSLGK